MMKKQTSTTIPFIVDHPSNSKRGGVCIYFKQSDNLGTMQESIITEISVNNETCVFTCFYRLLSQDYDKFDNFCS